MALQFTSEIFGNLGNYERKYLGSLQETFEKLGWRFFLSEKLPLQFIGWVKTNAPDAPRGPTYIREPSVFASEFYRDNLVIIYNYFKWQTQLVFNGEVYYSLSGQRNMSLKFSPRASIEIIDNIFRALYRVESISGRAEILIDMDEYCETAMRVFDELYNMPTTSLNTDRVYNLCLPSPK